MLYLGFYDEETAEVQYVTALVFLWSFVLMLDLLTRFCCASSYLPPLQVEHSIPFVFLPGTGFHFLETSLHKIRQHKASSTGIRESVTFPKWEKNPGMLHYVTFDLAGRKLTKIVMGIREYRQMTNCSVRRRNNY